MSVEKAIVSDGRVSHMLIVFPPLTIRFRVIQFRAQVPLLTRIRIQARTEPRNIQSR
jgi:hypothetical protein